MSEKISRRVFLKATGLAALSVAAAGALGGCGNLSPLPGNVTLTAPSEPYANLTNLIEVDLGSLYGQWTSNPLYEKASTDDDQHSHNYFYTGLYINNGSTDALKLYTQNFKCSLDSGADTDMTVRSLGNVKLNSGATQYEFTSFVEIPAGESRIIPMFIDIKYAPFSSLLAPFTITLTHSGKSINFKYVNYSEEPTTDPTV